MSETYQDLIQQMFEAGASKEAIDEFITTKIVEADRLPLFLYAVKLEAARTATRHAVARSHRGRTPGLTDIAGDSELCTAIRAMRVEGARITRATLAARAGFTEPALRGYLRATRRTMSELMESCSGR